MPNRRPEHFRVFALAGSLLAGAAGYVNVVTLLSPVGVTASHLSGTVTQLAAELSDEHAARAPAISFATVVAFLLGAAITGAALQSTQLAFGRRYGVLLVVEAALLAVASWLMVHGSPWGVVLAAMGCGLQNALATQYSQAVVRTTHLTGVVTDLGIALGKFIARRGVDGWRVSLYLGLLGGFLLGAAAGGRAFHDLGVRALWIPSALVGLLGLSYIGLRTARPEQMADDAPGG